MSQNFSNLRNTSRRREKGIHKLKHTSKKRQTPTCAPPFIISHTCKTRKHSSRMHTACSSYSPGMTQIPWFERDPMDRDTTWTETQPGLRHLWTDTRWTETPLGQRHPLDRDTSGQRHPLDRDTPGQKATS